VRENHTFRSGRLSVDYDHVETRGVLAGAYRGRDIGERATMTHLVFVGPPPREEDLRTGCQQPVDNMADVYSVSVEESAERPSCPACAKKWEKIPPELRGRREKEAREPNVRKKKSKRRPLGRDEVLIDMPQSELDALDWQPEGEDFSAHAGGYLYMRWDSRDDSPTGYSRIAAGPRRWRSEAPKGWEWITPTVTPNGGYYVWVLGANGEPLLEGPYGPHELTQAKQLARIGATEGKHNRAVSRGLHPTAESFAVVREYEAGTGDRIL